MEYNHKVKILLRIPILTVCIISEAQAVSEIKEWVFEIQTPGIYQLEVTHTFQDSLPQNTLANYIIRTQEKSYKRPIYLAAVRSGRPFRPLLAEIPNDQNVAVKITGVPYHILANTTVNLKLLEARSYRIIPEIEKLKSINFKELDVLKNIFSLPDDLIDLAQTKLIIDSFIDPALDVTVGMQHLMSIVSSIEAMLPFNATDYDRLITLRRYLYDAGPWNDYNPYQYDFTDPLGTKISNKLLMNYMDSRRGNCISMPFLFIALGEKLNLNLTASTAPLHVLVKYIDEYTNQTINLETTSGANPARDVWYRQQFQISDTAIHKGIYLNALSIKETVAVMAITLSEYYLEKDEPEKAIAISSLVLEQYPKYAYAMVKLGNAYYRLLEKHFLGKYPTINHIPVEQRDYYRFLSINNIKWFEEAETLGWREPTEEMDERYIRIINQESQKY